MNNYQNKNQQRDRGQYNVPKSKTFEELAIEIRNLYFAKNYDDILNMSKCEEFDQLIENIESFVQKEASAVSPSQLRNIYDKAIGARTVNELKMIRPKMAYVAGKTGKDGSGIRRFFAFIDQLIKKVGNDAELAEFKSFFESIVAYHKLYAKSKF